MLLKNPFKISARLLPSVQIGGVWISLERVGRDDERRMVYQYHIDAPALGWEHSAKDLRGGCGGCESLQTMFGTLLAFLDACAESRKYAHNGRHGENANLFPNNVGEWAEENSEEISMMRFDLEESKEVYIVE